MDDAQLMVLELAGKGYSCAQMVIIGGLRLMGRENPDLVRAMSGLAQGVACSGGVCGAFSGGACLIGLYCGKGLDAEAPRPEYPLLMDALLEWFREEAKAGGAVSCDAILGLNQAAVCRGMDPERCGTLVAACWTKAVSLLVEYNIDPMQGRDES